MWAWLHKLSSPPHFYRLAGKISPWLTWPAVALLGIGLYGGLIMAPPDYQMGEAFRIIYVHVPSAYMAMMVYMLMAVASAIGLIWRIKLAHAVAASAAPMGASFAAMALCTGMLWGKPMWGTYWDWDPRLTSTLVLFFVYLGYMALRSAFDDVGKADRACAILALVGVVNVPIIHFSVEWWNSLHQGPSLSRLQKPAIDNEMLWPLLLLILAFTVYFAGLLLVRTRAEVLRRERSARWVRELVTT